MRSIAFLLLKGGIGKTTSAVNFAYLLGAQKHKKVLLVDLDQQGNTTQLFGCGDDNAHTLSELLVDSNIDIKTVIQKTRYPEIDVIGSDSSLIKANQDIVADTKGPQHERLSRHLDKIAKKYDYCIFDCPTATTMSTLNALAYADDVLCPVRIDRYAFDAIIESINLVNEMREYNPKLSYKGAFVTMYQNTSLCNAGISELKSNDTVRLFDTKVRFTTKAGESTFYAPLCAYAPKSTAAEDYVQLVNEYLTKRAGGGRNNSY